MTIGRVFSDLRAGGRAALVPYFMADFPDPKTFRTLLREAEGADLLEVGVPFSDPIADGAVIRAAAAHVLRRGKTRGGPHGVRLAGILETLEDLRDRLAAPPLLMTYLNPVLAYGWERFARDAARCGVAGVVLPDLDLAAMAPTRRRLSSCGIDVAPLAAPTSTAARLRSITRAARGFLYLVSVTGTTGVRRAMPLELPRNLARVRRAAREVGRRDLPVVVGFGVGDPATAATVARRADGIVVGSALVRELAAAPRGAGARRALRLLAAMRTAIDRSRERSTRDGAPRARTPRNPVRTGKERR